jgi:5'-3' exonuclease
MYSGIFLNIKKIMGHNVERNSDGFFQEYEYVILDGSLYLYSTMFAISQNGTARITVEDETKGFLQKIYKIIRDWTESGYNIGTKKVLILWDKSPYYKKEIVGEYKGDRHYGDDTEKEKWIGMLSSGHTTDEINYAKRQIELIDIKSDNFNTANTTKYELINNLKGTSLFSYILPGYEADDLAYQLSVKLEQEEKTGLLLTTDKDWIHMTNRYVDYYSTCSGTKNHDLEINKWKSTNKELLNYNIQLDLYSYGVLRELHSNSHNGVLVFSEGDSSMTFIEFVKRLFNPQEYGSLGSYEIYQSTLNRYNAMHAGRGTTHNYNSETKELVNDMIHNLNYEKGKLISFINDNNINTGNPCKNTISVLEKY